MSNLNHLVVYLSGGCNLNCLYCNFRKNYFRSAIRENVLLKRIESFLAWPSGGKRVTFLGGEPLLHFKLLKKAVSVIKKKDCKIPIVIFTNGTLLDGEKISFFKNNNVEIMISLDGNKRITDRFRKFPYSKKSVFKRVSEIFKKYGIKKMAVNMVVTPETAGNLRESVKFLYERGFRIIGWNVDCASSWPLHIISEIKRQISGIRLDYLRLIKGGRDLYRFSNCYEIIEWLVRGKRTGCSNVSLFPDGNFYFCDKVFGLKKSALSPFRITFLKGRPDFKKRRAFFAAFKKEGIHSRQLMCPLGIYLHYRFVKGLEGAELDHSISATMRLVKVVEAGKTAMIKELLKYEPFRRVHGI